MRLPLFIAKRYLFAKKSHNVINVISLISASGIALGTMALVVILSVYNGFEGLIKSLYSAGEADILIAPAAGKSFSYKTVEFDKVRELAAPGHFCPVAEENVFVKYGNGESIAAMKGVDSVFAAHTKISKFMTEGEFQLYEGEVPLAVAGKGIAAALGIRTHFTDPLYFYYPSRNSSLSLINPASSLNQERLFPGGIFSIEQTLDRKYIFVPLETAQNLLELEDNVTAVEIYYDNETGTSQVIEQIKSVLGAGFTVKDRYMQNETLYKMMKAEKLTIYMILLFVVIIISFNLFGSLSMLILEKSEDTETLRSMGAGEDLVRRIFLLEGWMISLLGMVTGLVLGIIISLLQQNFGFVKMPGNFIIDAYPVVVSIWDIVYIAIGVGFVGYLSARLPLRILKKN